MTTAAPPAIDPLLRGALTSLCGSRLAARLSERQLRILHASVIEGRDYQDIGAREGITPNAIKVNLTRIGYLLGFELVELRPRLLAGYWWLAGTVGREAPGGFE